MILLIDVVFLYAQNVNRVKMQHFNKSEHTESIPLLQRGIEGDFPNTARTY